MLIVSNFEGFPEKWEAASGLKGTSVHAASQQAFVRNSSAKDALLLVNCEPQLTLKLGALRRLGVLRAPLVAIDLILRRPANAAQRISIFLKRQAFAGVDYFIHYFRAVEGLYEVYGIGADRSGFVRFKGNLWDLRAPAAQPDGEYALCFGRSLRDFDTFFSAIEICGLPGAIVDPIRADILTHGSRFTRPLRDLPPNVRVLEHDLSARSQATVLRDARVVVIPILRTTIVSAGISTALNAMLMGKCVIATSGPGTSDIFGHEMILVPPEEPARLAEAMSRAWTDADLRTDTARAGYQYAVGCGTIADFYQRTIDDLAVRFGQRVRDSEES